MTLRLRLIVIAAAILVAVGAAWLTGLLAGPGGRLGEIADAARPSVGGPFSLVDQDGRTRTDAEFRGKIMLIYFGYTYCPDVCPTGLAAMGQAMDKLGAQAKDVVPIFATIDPERDTPAVMKEYVAQFGPEFLGLTGSAQQVGAAARAYRVYYQKAPTAKDDPNYLMDHSSIIYLMDRQGKYRTHFTHESAPADIAEAVRQALK